MHPKKKEHPAEKTKLHTRNKHRERYDFKELIAACPDLEQYVSLNIYKDESIDFFNPEAVRTLNFALLKRYYGIDHWNIPAGYLCPPIPGRADYIHHVADLLGANNYGKTPSGPKIRCLDIGVGANCIYPLIGHAEYGWSFVGTETDPVAIRSAQEIIEQNALTDSIEIRLQTDPESIFQNIIQKDELFELSICNPPFHSSAEEANAGAVRKLSNLKKERINDPVLNFGGKSNELWCKGGEEEFALNMVHQSWKHSMSCYWYTTLISKQSHLKSIYIELDAAGAKEVKTIQMGQGNKSSRIVAWSFLSPEQKKEWKKTRWDEGK
ncbi:MAG: Ribosomal large subunit methyltransferase [Bacteroidetes bacterium]|jgi:23S rRNA (adenine1618-N6)-methyltransferase|nr:Ribosomal large subunit methyltransferase [Bacteroidota bacterium]